LDKQEMFVKVELLFKRKKTKESDHTK